MVEARRHAESFHAPRRVRCPLCGAVVVATSTHEGAELLLDPHECLPRMPCPACAHSSAPATLRACERCGGLGRIGCAMPRDHHATLDEEGVARVPCPSDLGRRRSGQAMHHTHRCRR